MTAEPWSLELRNRIESPDYKQEIYVISVPRSGNTITRYILEHLTRYESYGYAGSGGRSAIDNRCIAANIPTRDKSGIIFKRHAWSHQCRFSTDKESQDVVCITVIRNPLDIKLRREKLTPNTWETYTDVVTGALKSNKPGKIVFYETLMSDPERYVRELAQLVRCPQDRLDEFLKDIDSHLSGPKKAPEQLTPNQLEPNVRNLPEDERINNWNQLMCLFPDRVQEFFNYHYPNGRWVSRE